MEVTSAALDKHEAHESSGDRDVYKDRTEQDLTAVSEVVESPQASKIRTKEHIQFAALCYSLFLAGYNDGSTGPLLPRLQNHYNVGYTIVSLIWIFNCIGFMSGAAANVWFTTRLGFGKTIVLGAAAQAVAYAIQSGAPPFPAFVLGFFINGFGLSLQDAQANGYVAALQSETKMGVLHSVYGLGALTAPLVSTQFARLPRHWSLHYVTALGVALSTALLLALVFRGRSQDACLAEIGRAGGEVGTSEQSHFRQIMGLRAVHLLAAFIFVYVGVEVSLGGWMVTFIIQERGGGASSGYVSSGFFGGLMLGRVLLLWVNKTIGERRVIYIYAVLCIGLDIVIWRVRSLIGNAVAASFIGFFLGPMYPIAMNVSTRVLPPWLLTGSIGWIAGLGQAGSALLPFITGAIASRAGIGALQPVLIAMMALMLLLWAFVPRERVVEEVADEGDVGATG